MARLRVGDIEIDGANISIGGVPQVPVTSTRSDAVAADGAAGASTAAGAKVETSTTVASSRGATVAITSSRPVASTALVPASTSTSLARSSSSASANASTIASSSEGLDALATLPIGERTLIGGGLALAAGGGAILAITTIAIAMVMVMSGVGAVALGLLKHRAVARRALAEEAAADRELSVHAAALRPLLAEPKQDQTVEWITARAGLPEATVVRTLAFMRARGDIVEELNTDTGEWYYAAVPALPAASLPLDERLALIDGAEGKR